MKLNLDLGLLIIRVALGATMLAHGIQKFGRGIPGVQGGFEAMGLPMPQLLGVVVPLIETVGGLMLIAGFGTWIAALGNACVALGAMFTVHLESGYYAQDGGFEFVLLLALIAIGVALTGPGRYSADAFVAVPGLNRLKRKA